ncbi:MAG TPA: hypothetical protein VFQ65_21295 [Kofleriaceae bacterium]|nr:hypothetical protein [Kofleriaceae bacterium]
MRIGIDVRASPIELACGGSAKSMFAAGDAAAIDDIVVGSNDSGLGFLGTASTASTMIVK